MTSVLYASPLGTGEGKGTRTEPLDLQTAVERCRSGQEIFLLPGRYLMAEDVVITPQNSGAEENPKRITAVNAPGQWAILDFGGSSHCFCIDGNYWDICGLTVTGGFGFCIRGSHNRIHDCCSILNRETGFLIRHPLIDSPKELWPSYNSVEDCVSCLNMDLSGQNADGFACKVAAGPGNQFVRCYAWMNSDDGFDLFSKNRTIGAVRLKECRSWLNGYVMKSDGTLQRTRGNGNGFKLGGSGSTADHEADGCEAVGNRGFGFTSNSNPHMFLDGCRSENNEENYKYYFTGPGSQPILSMKDCSENADPLFDPYICAKQNIIREETDNTDYSSVETVLSLLQREKIEKYNDELLQESLMPIRGICEETEDGRSGVMVMCSSLYGGGAERVACRLASGLAGKYRVIMLYINDKGLTYPLDPDIRIFKMPVFLGTWRMKMRSRAEFAGSLKELFGIRASISFMFTMNKINIFSKGDDKVICSERNNPAKRDPDHLEEIGGLYELADHVVFQSKTVRDLFSEKVRDHSSIILNPVEVSCCRADGRHRIVNIGRLVPQKNQAMLIRAFADFYRTHRDHTLSFYGEGELESSLRELAQSLDAGEAVQFHGHVRDIHSAIADAEIFALSSDYEGLSNALLECMMMGLPCISTRCEGSTDIIRSGENGILVDIGDEKQMSNALKRLAESAELRDRLGSGALQTAERFRSDVVLQQWEQLLEKLSSEI